MSTAWRYRCPEGHTTYRTRSTKGTIYCRQCGDSYPEKLDAKTGELVSV